MVLVADTPEQGPLGDGGVVVTDRGHTIPTPLPGVAKMAWRSNWVVYRVGGNC